jgi:hypothetical protein
MSMTENSLWRADLQGGGAGEAELAGILGPNRAALRIPWRARSGSVMLNQKA